nr:proline-rich receptor-like protein kinase PERK10 [Penaeus vannamei]
MFLSPNTLNLLQPRLLPREATEAKQQQQQAPKEIPPQLFPPPSISSRQTGSAPPPGECQAPSRVLSASASGARAGNHGAEAERPGPRMKFLARARPSGGLHPDASARQRNSWKVPPRSPRVTADQAPTQSSSPRPRSPNPVQLSKSPQPQPSPAPSPRTATDETRCKTACARIPPPPLEGEPTHPHTAPGRKKRVGPRSRAVAPAPGGKRPGAITQVNGSSPLRPVERIPGHSNGYILSTNTTAINQGRHIPSTNKRIPTSITREHISSSTEK